MREVVAVRRLLALLAALFIGCSFPALAEAVEYVENEWNYVDGSMDVSGGIPENAQGTLASIRDAGVLRVATNADYPPQEFIDPAQTGQAQYIGSDMELARAIAERMGVTLEIVHMDFSQVLDAVAEGDCDLAISGLAFTPERSERVELSKGYHFTDAGDMCGFVVRADEVGDYPDLASLAGKDIAAQGSSLQETIVAQNVNNYHEFRRLGSIQAVYAAVAEGKSDLGAVDLETVQSYIESNPDCGLVLLDDLRFSLESQFEGDRIAAKKGELQLMYFVNGVIDQLLATNQYRQWFDQYDAIAREMGY